MTTMPVASTPCCATEEPGRDVADPTRSTPATCTFMVINLATDGHPRIDVDEFLITDPLHTELKP